MKRIYTLMCLCALTLPVLFTACSGSDDDPTPVDPVKKEIKLDAEKADIVVSQATSITIVDGAGEYKAFSTNTDVATVEMEGAVLHVTGVALGNTNIVVTDAQDNYLLLPVISHYETLAIDREKIEVAMPLGWTKTVKCPITEGNLGYEATTESEDIEVSIEAPSTLVVKGIKECTTTVHLIDSYGLEMDIPVEVKTSTVPFTDQDKEDLMAQTDQTITFDQTDYNSSYYDRSVTLEDGVNKVGFTYYTYYYGVVSFPGDLTVGTKADATLRFKYGWGSTAVNYEDEPVTCEVLKNDGTKIWLIFYFTKDEKLHFGHMILDL